MIIAERGFGDNQIGRLESPPLGKQRGTAVNHWTTRELVFWSLYASHRWRQAGGVVGGSNSTRGYAAGEQGAGHWGWLAGVG